MDSAFGVNTAISPPNIALPTSPAVFPESTLDFHNLANHFFIPNDDPTGPVPPTMETAQHEYEIILVLDRVCDLINHRSCFRTALSLGIVNIWTVLNSLPAKNRDINLEAFHHTDLYQNVRYFDSSMDCVEELKRENFEIWTSTLSPEAIPFAIDNLQSAAQMTDEFFGMLRIERFQQQRLRSRQTGSGAAGIHNTPQTIAQFDEYSSQLHQMLPKIPKRVAIVVGREADGASEVMIQNSNQQIYLPMVGFAESFNVGVAGALLLHRVVTLCLNQHSIDQQAREFGLPAVYNAKETLKRPQRSRILTKQQQIAQWIATRTCIDKLYSTVSSTTMNPTDQSHLLDQVVISSSLHALYNGACAGFIETDIERRDFLKQVGLPEITLKMLHSTLISDQINLHHAIDNNLPLPGIGIKFAPRITGDSEVDHENENDDDHINPLLTNGTTEQTPPVKLTKQQVLAKRKKNNERTQLSKNASKSAQTATEPGSKVPTLDSIQGLNSTRAGTKTSIGNSKAKDSQGDQCCNYSHSLLTPSPNDPNPLPISDKQFDGLEQQLVWLQQVIKSNNQDEICLTLNDTNPPTTLP